MDASLQARGGKLPVRRASLYARYAQLVSHPHAAVATTERMRVEILELRDDAPVRLRFDFIEPLRDVRLYVWKGRRVELLPLPNIGTTTHVPAASAM